MASGQTTDEQNQGEDRGKDSHKMIKKFLKIRMQFRGEKVVLPIYRPEIKYPCTKKKRATIHTSHDI